MTDLENNADRVLELAGAVCNRSASEEDLIALNTLLHADRNSRRRYVDYCWIHVALRLQLRAGQAAKKAYEQTSVGAPVSTDDGANDAEMQVCISPPPRIFSTALYGSGDYISSNWPLAYLIATIIVGVGIAVTARVNVSSPEPIVCRSSLHSSISLLPSVVGQITDMVDCKLAGKPQVVRDVPLGATYTLESGLMELTYNTGAKVILQGPVTYKVESASGGFLAIGKLVGRMETAQAKGFMIRTPSAAVTDLGTEFGVQVDRDGNHDVQVFAGKVKVQVRSEHANQSREMFLNVNQAIRFNAAGESVTRHTAMPVQFVRSMKTDVTSRANRSIGVNFTCGARSNLAPNDETGMARAGNWNNVDGTPPQPPAVKLHDASGKQTDAVLAWQWLSAGGPPKYCACPDNSGMAAVFPFERLMDGRFNGVVDVTVTNGVLDVNAPRTPVSLMITVHNIPYPNYRVYVYYSTTPACNDPGNGYMHTFGLSVNGRKPVVISRPKAWLNDFYRYESETRSGNYRAFDGLVGDLTIHATEDGPGPLHDKFIAGFQIVETSQ